jgi:hypothetical protein
LGHFRLGYPWYYWFYWQNLLINFNKSVQRSVDRVKCCWSSPAQPILGSGPVGIHDCIFVLSKTFMCFGMGPPCQRVEGSDYTGHSLRLYWGVTRPGTHSLTGPYLHGLTDLSAHFLVYSWPWLSYFGN